MKKTGEKEDGFDINKDYSQYSLAPRNSNNDVDTSSSKTKRHNKALEAKIVKLESDVIISESDDTDDAGEPPLHKKKGTTFLLSKKR